MNPAYKKGLFLYEQAFFIPFLPLVYMRSPIRMYKQDFNLSISTVTITIYGLTHKNFLPLHITL